MDKKEEMHTHTHTHTHPRILLSHKKEGNLAILLFGKTWMIFEGIIVSKISQTEKDKYCTHFHLYAESKNQNK